MKQDNLSLRDLGVLDDGKHAWLASFSVDGADPVWAVVKGPANQGMAIVAVMEQATRIPWRGGPLPDELPTAKPVLQTRDE